MGAPINDEGKRIYGVSWLLDALWGLRVHLVNLIT